MKTTRSRRLSAFGVAALLVACLALVVPGSHAFAAAGEVLKVSFGGSFSSGNDYTSAGNEVLGGALVRDTGNESLDPATGVDLGGGRSGLTFTPTEPVSGGAVQRSVVLEAAFTPSGGQGSLATVLALGGQVFARYNGGQLQYGFSVEHAGSWTDHTQSVPAPAAGAQHVIGLAYEVTSTGATLHAYLDGKSEPAVVSTSGAATWAGGAAGGQIGIGNEVNPGGLSRGFTGSIRSARVATFDGPFTPSDLALQTVTESSRVLRVDFEGAIDADDAYRPALGETAQPAPTIDGTIPDTGRLTLGGGDGITWNAGESAAWPVVEGVVAEAVVEPSALTPGNDLIDLYGAARLVAAGPHAVTLRAGGRDINVPLPAIQQKSGLSYQHVSLAAEPSDGALAITALVGPDQHAAATVTVPSSAAARSTIQWFKNTRGTAYAIGVSTFTGESPSKATGLADMPCVAGKLTPSSTIRISSGECLTSLVAKAAAVRPDPRQASWQDLGQTAFLHFGINTFTGAEWGTGDEDPKVFNPKELDTDQWARTLKQAGFKLAVLVVKHHDGFLLYPSRYSAHSVASSSWEGGKGDVLRDFTASMHKYGLKAGVYLSPADENQYLHGVYADGSAHVTHTIPTLVPGDDRAGRVASGQLPTFHLKADDYGAYMLNQLYEVLTQYGPIDEVWFDGAEGRIPPGKVESYDFPSWYALIRALQPQAVIAVSGPDARWVGNERGVARPDNEWSVVPTFTDPSGQVQTALDATSQDLGSRAALLAGQAAGATELRWYPAECDVSLHSGWFWHEGDGPKSVSALMSIYNSSVGDNCNLLLNVPPDQNGQIAPADVDVLTKWRAAVEAELPSDLLRGAHVSGDGSRPTALTDGSADTAWNAPAASSGSVEVSLPAPITVNRVSLSEDIRQGQLLENATLFAKSDAGGWEQLATFKAVGSRRILTLSHAVTTSQFRLVINQSRGPVRLTELAAYQGS